MEMVVNGVSSRKVTKITEDLCGASFSKSTVSQLCTGLDARVAGYADVQNYRAAESPRLLSGARLATSIA